MRLSNFDDQLSQNALSHSQPQMWLVKVLVFVTYERTLIRKLCFIASKFNGQDNVCANVSARYTDYLMMNLSLRCRVRVEISFEKGP